jgi:hypothetical protein
VLARAQDPGTVVLRWDAPADAPGAVAVAHYDARLSTALITPANFTAATVAPSGTPHAPGVRESLLVSGLVAGNSYWFAIRSQDAAGNWSAISNVVRWDGMLDTAPPAAPAGVTGVVQANGGSTQISWQAGTEPDLSGYYVYREIDPAGPWLRVAAGVVHATSYTDAHLPGGAGELWYALTAVDRAGNESARSSSIKVSLRGVLGALPTAWRLKPPFPNPALSGETMHMVVEVPAGSAGARLEIVDGVNQLVRRFDVSAAAGGLVQINWDGTNGSGAGCAPGVYRAWLVVGDTRSYVRIARVP